jgi:hypothetical protein
VCGENGWKLPLNTRFERSRRFETDFSAVRDVLSVSNQSIKKTEFVHVLSTFM